MSSNYSRYEMNAVKKIKGQKEPLNFNLVFYEDNKFVMEHIVKDLESRNWTVTVLRETMLPWDLTES